MNNGHLAGHLGADPEVRYTSSGQKVTTLRLAVSARKETVWWRVTIWGDQFDRMLPYLKKGSSLIVFGEMKRPEIYTDKNGQPQVSSEITAYHLAFNPFGKSDQSDHQGEKQATQPQMATQGAARETPSFSEDEIPF